MLPIGIEFRQKIVEMLLCTSVLGRLWNESLETLTLCNILNDFSGNVRVTCQWDTNKNHHLDHFVNKCDTRCMIAVPKFQVFASEYKPWIYGGLLLKLEVQHMINI